MGGANRERFRNAMIDSFSRFPLDLQSINLSNYISTHKVVDNHDLSTIKALCCSPMANQELMDDIHSKAEMIDSWKDLAIAVAAAADFFIVNSGVRCVRRCL
jgi:hypothetical protein